MIHDLVQGSPEWDAFRLEHDGASEAAPMLGLSPHVSRTELLHMKFTCTGKEFSDWVKHHILDHGHRVEALARPLVEAIIGTELYPVTCSQGRLSASLDGLTMMEDIAFEHKQWNEALADSVANKILPDEHQPQCQQIMMVTPAEQVIFVVSDGTADNMVWMMVAPDPVWQERIRAGWAQFHADLAVYEPKNFTPKRTAEPIMQLPALAIQIRGEVTLSNLPQFKAKAEQFIASIKTDLLTDEDFANAEATIKFCDAAEKNLEHAKRSAIAQTSSIDELMRTVDLISEQLRAKRLMLTSTVADKKALIRAGILNAAKVAFAEHVAALEAEIAPLRLVYQTRDFAGVMKNKRTLATLHDAVDTELAAGKITVDALAQAVRARLTWYREHAAGHEFLFADLQNVIQKCDEDFQLLVRTRIQQHQTKEAAAPQHDPIGQAEHDARPSKVYVPSESAADLTAYGAPTLRLGHIAERLGFALSADFLRALGFEPVARDKAAVLYHEFQFGHICAALHRHIRDACEKQAEAA
jgi:predicted phage-related endonuclease